MYPTYRPQHQQITEKERQQERKEKKSLIVAIIATVILGLLVGTIAVGNMVGPSYQYNKTVHSHMVNAWCASTPELLGNQIELAMQGMRQLGLTEDLYGKLMPWQQTPDWRMDYCYLHLQAIVNRSHEIIEWRNHQDLESGQVTDVYNQKMNNLRAFIVEDGWSDYIAKGAFYVNFHPFYYAWWGVVKGVALVFVILAWSRALATFAEEPEDPEELPGRILVYAISLVIIVLVLISIAAWLVGR